jgi:hypothetical protein
LILGNANAGRRFNGFNLLDNDIILIDLSRKAIKEGRIFEPLLSVMRS